MGKLIVFEGTDGSGKSTQFELLAKRLEAEQIGFQRLRFPQYEEPSSALIRMYLGGAFGDDPEAVNAYAASTFYAVDRYASYQCVWKDYYQGGGLVVSDRYTTSNAVHQGSKVPEGERAEFFRWLYDLEYDRMGLPRPDLVVLLDMPVELSEQLMRKREQSTGTHADIHERDEDYLKKCRDVALHAAKYYGWRTVLCAKDGAIRGVEDIHEEVYAIVKSCLED
ncbi:MAG: thymidylate kinase [Clostridia bacterium]|nr:MAG: thymidylate kinase [Clostridia bacterium]